MIEIDKSWDLSAQINATDTNNNVVNQTIWGRFDPSTDPEDLQNLLMAINSFTTNTYVDAKLSAKKSLSAIIDDDPDEIPFDGD